MAVPAKRPEVYAFLKARFWGFFPSDFKSFFIALALQARNSNGDSVVKKQGDEKQHLTDSLAKNS